MEVVCPACSTTFNGMVASGGGAEAPCPECGHIVDLGFSGPELSLDIPDDNLSLDLGGGTGDAGAESGFGDSLSLDSLDDGPLPSLDGDFGGPALGIPELATPDTDFDDDLGLPTLSVPELGGGGGDTGSDLGLPAMQAPQLGAASDDFDDDLGLPTLGVPEALKDDQADRADVGSLNTPSGDLSSGGMGPVPALINEQSTLSTGKTQGRESGRGAGSVERVHFPEIKSPSASKSSQSSSTSSRPAYLGRDTSGISDVRRVVVARSSADKLKMAAVVGVVSLLTVAFVGWSIWKRSLPPPPPAMLNPMEVLVDAWEDAGRQTTFPSFEEALAVAKKGLESSSNSGIRKARNAVEDALIFEEDDPRAIALYCNILARWPETLSDDELRLASAASMAAIGDDPKGEYRSDLEAAKAWVAFRGGSFSSARKAAKLALEIDPNSVTAQVAHAVISASMNPAASLKTLKSIKKTQSTRWRTIWLADVMVRAGLVNEARSTWTSLLKGNMGDSVPLRRLGMLELQLGSISSAEARFDELVTKGWASLSDRILLSRLLSRAQNRHSDAIKILEAAFNIPLISNRNKAEVLTEKVRVALLSREISEKVLSSWLDAAFHLAPDLPELLYVAGIADWRAGYSKDALESLDAAIGAVPSESHIAIALAMSQIQNDEAAARMTVKNALSEVPDAIGLHLVKALLDLRANDALSAAVSIRSALSFDPEVRRHSKRFSAFAGFPAAYTNLGRELSSYAKERGNPLIMSAAGISYYLAGQTSVAQRWFSKALILDDEDTGARLYRAILYYRQGNNRPASRELERGLNSDNRQRTLRLYRARLYERARKWGRAESFYRDLIQQNAIDSAAKIGLARSLAASGRLKEAREAALSVLSGRPDDREALVFFERGQPKRLKKTDKRSRKKSKKKSRKKRRR